MSAPVAVVTSGYHGRHGLLIVVALSAEGVGALLTGQALAFDLREQGLPRGHVIVAAGVSPDRVAVGLGTDEALEALLGGPEPAREAMRWACPGCQFRMGGVPAPGALVPLEDVPRCPNDGQALEPWRVET